MSSAERKNVLSDSKQCKKKTKNFKREKKEQKNSFIAFLSTLEIFFVLFSLNFNAKTTVRSAHELFRSQRLTDFHRSLNSWWIAVEF